MPNIGDKTHSRDLGFKQTLSWYIWSACSLCGKQAWVRVINIKRKTWICSNCSNHQSRISKSILEIKQSGIRECNKCHRILSADDKHFSKSSRLSLGIGATCIECTNKHHRLKYQSKGKIEIVCSICGRTELVWNAGNHKSICGGCSQKLSGKQKLPRGKRAFKPRAVSMCKICKVEYPATDEYFCKNKQTKNGLSLGRCKKCAHRIAKSRSLSTIKGRLNRRMGNYIRMFLNGTKNFKHWETLVGYTLKDLIKHLEKRFKIGMSWENYGKWHIDHIIPQAAFHYTSPDDVDFKRCWALKNLQPLWHWENESKGGKILKPFQPSLKLENKI